jgi:hypothetical protein
MLRALFYILLVLIITGMTVWGALFLCFSPLPPEPLRIGMAGAFALGTLVAFALFRKRCRTLLMFLVAFGVLVAWFHAIPPSNDRQWAPEVAVLGSATVNGNLVTIKNIRNFDYRSESDFTPRYYDKTFDIDKLQSVDLVCVYWGSPAIAHIMASFGFGGSDFVAFSIEMRPEKGEARSMVRSFFRNYELIYVVADERDVIRLRTNYRNPREQVHIYRTRLPVENQRKLFLSYVGKINELYRTPEWYGALKDNCTTGALERTGAYEGRGRYNWKVLLSGYAAEYAYECGVLDASMAFSELSQRCLVNAKAEAADQAEDFSARIRVGLPTSKPYTLQEFLSPP